ncbi:MAG: hypothetical protein KAR56_03185 [Thermoplasmata archaeon]|nr:hypothetical protein [Thermoplasmata archaeon]
MVEQVCIDVKLPKDRKYGILIIVSFFIIWILFFHFIIASGDLNNRRYLFNIIFTVFLLTAMIFIPLFVYRQVPRRIILKKNELIVITRVWGKKTIPKKDIHNISKSMSVFGAQMLYGVHHIIKDPRAGILLDEKPGKLVYDWYYENKLPDNEQRDKE